MSAILTNLLLILQISLNQWGTRLILTAFSRFTPKFPSRADTHGEQVGPALGLLPDRCGRVGGRDIDPQFLLAGARRRRDGRGVVT